MFSHNYIYRLKCIVKDKQTMFWTLIFPILLATLFNLALSNISNTESFSRIKIAVVDNAEFEQDAYFAKAIEAASASDKTAGNNALFDVAFASKEEADKLLNKNKIDGYIYFENGIKLIVKKSGMNQTIIKGFLDDYIQTASTITTIMHENSPANGELLNSISNRTDYLKAAAVSKAAPNTIVIYFYALIAMTCLYGSFLGLKEVTAIQANLSSQAARVNMAPTHKLKMFTASMLAAATVQIAEILILLGYLILILRIDFGNQVGYIALTCIIGTITGVSFGTCVASIIKKGEGIKLGILIGLTMTMAFLSGMMYHGIKYIINTKAPILKYINPVDLISDSLYSLYYNNNIRYFTDIALLSVFAVVFSVITYFVLRRQKYASL